MILWILLVISATPITADIKRGNDWHWKEIKDSSCRDGSKAGIYVKNAEHSSHVVIFLEGGNACFNRLTCGLSPRKVRKKNLIEKGILSNNQDSPVHNWNFVYVPYCTGDIHSGSSRNVLVPGVGTQHFVGYDNLTLILKWIKGNFDDINKILLAGASAGGYGTIFNYEKVTEYFQTSVVYLLDDSGIPLTDQYLAPCLQKKVRDLWNFDIWFSKRCKNCRKKDGGGLYHYIHYLLQKYDPSKFGFVSSYGDTVIRKFYGFGHKKCKGSLPFYPLEKFKAGLRDFATQFSHYGIHLNFFDGIDHVHILSNKFFQKNGNQKSIADWLKNMINRHNDHI